MRSFIVLSAFVGAAFPGSPIGLMPAGAQWAFLALMAGAAAFALVGDFMDGEARRAAKWAVYRRLMYPHLTNERALYAWERDGRPAY